MRIVVGLYFGEVGNVLPVDLGDFEEGVLFKVGLKGRGLVSLVKAELLFDVRLEVAELRYRLEGCLLIGFSLENDLEGVVFEVVQLGDGLLHHKRLHGVLVGGLVVVRGVVLVAATQSLALLVAKAGVGHEVIVGALVGEELLLLLPLQVVGAYVELFH